MSGPAPFNEPLPAGLGRKAVRLDPREYERRSMIVIASAVATGSFHGTNPRTGESDVMRAVQFEFAGRWVGGADAALQTMLDVENARALHAALGAALDAIDQEDPAAPALRDPRPSDLREDVELTVADREDLRRLWEGGSPLP